MTKPEADSNDTIYITLSKNTVSQNSYFKKVKPNIRAIIPDEILIPYSKSSFTVYFSNFKPISCLIMYLKYSCIF